VLLRSALVVAAAALLLAAPVLAEDPPPATTTEATTTEATTTIEATTTAPTTTTSPAVAPPPALADPLPLAHARLTVGATEDAAKSEDLLTAKTKMDLARLAGLRAIRVSTIWSPPLTEPRPQELRALQNAASAGLFDGIRVIVSVYQFSRNTPTTPAARAQFAAYAAAVARELPTVNDVIVGNEPNLNLFWMPQFGSRGADLAAPAYEALLAETYDALKAVNPTINVIGGSVSPRGQDKARSPRQTHSPTTFIPDLGKAYRASHRAKPIMDMFAFHPYGDNSSQPPAFAHPRTTSIGIADYKKLVGLLRTAFAGTRQKGATLPIIYDEYGLDSVIPPEKASLYTSREPAQTRPLPESLQGARYGQAIGIVACQPTVEIMLLFHVTDEPGLGQWQSGVYYADDAPKASLPAVRAAANRAAAGCAAKAGLVATRP
jgi:hypothetical protein